MRSIWAWAGAALLTGAATAQPAEPDVARRFVQLSRTTVWTPVAAIRLRFRSFHPQGMVRVGDDFYLSAVEVTRKPRRWPTPRDGHDRDAGAGVGHLFKFGADGRLLADLRLGEGSIYHPGGIDYDGTAIWVPVAEYRSASRAIVYRVSPETMTATKVLTVDDHIGGVVHDREGGALIGVNWGSRRLYRWPLAPDGTVGAPATVANTNGYIDYQDCHAIGAQRMLCAGLAEYRVGRLGLPLALGGIDLIDLATLRATWQVPVPLWAASGRPMTQNPFWMEATATGLRAWFVPDDDRSTLYVYDAAVGG